MSLAVLLLDISDAHDFTIENGTSGQRLNCLETGAV